MVVLDGLGITQFGEENTENRECVLCTYPQFSGSNYFNCLPCINFNRFAFAMVKSFHTIRLGKTCFVY